jgi:hypothetical protein
MIISSAAFFEILHIFVVHHPGRGPVTDLRSVVVEKVHRGFRRTILQPALQLGIGVDETIYFACTDTNLYAGGPDGTLKWKFAAKDINQTTPALAPDGTIYFGSQDGRLYALYPDGRKRWEYWHGVPFNYGSPAVAQDGTILIGSVSSLLAITPGGTRKWQVDGFADILDRRFLVVESDILKKNEVGAVFRWLRESCGLKLVAVIDTAGKSLHGWFDFVSCEPVLDELRLVLPSLKCDPKLFTASQPVRLPGAERDGNLQRLVYLAKEDV